MSIYEKLLRKADKGGRYKIDLNTKDLWIGKEHVIKEGVVQNDENLINKDDLKNVFGMEIDLSENTWSVVSYLYQEYKHSVPSEKWKDGNYFKALPYEELSTDELAYNITRKFGQAMLEGYILLGSLNGWLQWENENQWFYQDKNDGECIVLKSWIENK